MGCEPVPSIFADADMLGRALAGEIIAALRAKASGRFLLGCPGGRSLLPTYRALAAGLDPSSMRDVELVIVVMDDYLAPGRPPRLCDPRAHFSCRRFARCSIQEPLAAALGRPVPAWLPDPAEPEAFEARLAAAGGIDLFLLASGASDGHVAFNPPGSARDSRTRVIELALTTRRDNLATFPDFGGLDAVPTHGVSVGIDTIARHSRDAVLVLTGTGKREAARRVLAARTYDPAWPATVVHACRGGRVYHDEAAQPLAGGPAQPSISR